MAASTASAVAHCFDSECDFISTVKADEATRFAEETNELPACVGDTRVVETLELGYCALVGAIVASRVEASSEMEVSLAVCLGATAELTVGGVEVPAGSAGEHDRTGEG